MHIVHTENESFNYYLAIPIDYILLSTCFKSLANYTLHL